MPFSDYPVLRLEGFASPRTVSALLIESRGFPSRRVSCGDGDVRWTERAVPSASEFAAYFRSEAVLESLVSHTQSDALRYCRVVCWTSEYASGEYINAHRDASGDLQLIVALRASPRELGGALHVSFDGRSEEIYLRAGDAVLFEAHRAEHWTTPVGGSDDANEALRIVAVGRYFFS